MRLAALLLALACAAAQAAPLTVGSKRFTESYILGELIAQTARAAGAEVDFRPGMGGTAILYEAVRTGAIDLYPEYTGTLARELLEGEAHPTLRALNAKLAPLGLAVSVPLGFNNTYALGVRGEVAARLKLKRISDLKAQPGLRLGFGHEFLGRRDGWPGLSAAYGLPQRPRGLDHGLAYEALAAGEVDVIDLYSTDAKIGRYGIAVLEDDRGFFPAYDAVLLHRADVPQRFARAWKALLRLEGSIDADEMRRLNAAAELEERSFAEAARLHRGSSPAAGGERGFLDALLGPDLGRLTREHLLLVFASLAAGVALGVPLGTAAAKWARAAQPILALVGVVQTIPSLALFAFLIVLMGAIGTLPALVALFLYALLPIVRNTHAGLAGVSRGMRDAALALGLRPAQRLWKIELPLALPTILAGVKTSAVINVGTATIAAFIGAGGYGERIASGLALNDSTLLLAGAVPAAVLALAVQGAFELAERRFAWMRRAARPAEV
ncbi:MAG TPA: glycine betaine ABC transporter substrate-binding protein [Burkholderiales bacterium]|nr:glycine betaine ABC transporter substrate-binding protein [Burkholderiales bacterium]